ncbi:MAG: lipid II flippase MurJ [Candidatus Dormiibacterota bacterium]
MNADGSTPGSGRQSDRAIVRQSGLTGVAAAAGVAAGLILDVSIAFGFGAGPNTDAFFVASRIPIGLVAVVMVAANQALVPAFRTSSMKRGEKDTDHLISMVLCTVVVVGIALVLLSWLFAVPLMRITAPGIKSGEVNLAASMLPIVFAMVPLVAVAEVMRAYLNARYAFVAPALMTVVLNGLAALVIIGGGRLGLHDIHLVAYAFLAGAVAQAVFMCAMALRQGHDFRPALDIHDEHLRGIGKLCVRPVGAAALNPAARIGEQLVVSFLPTGSITVLNYGYLVVSAVGGTVFFRSVIVALIPRLTDAHNRGGQVEVRRFTGLGMRIMLAISLPLTAFMAVLARPAAIAVFERGSFKLPAAELLGTVLAVYAVSLVGSAVQRALLAPFFARLDTRTPLRNTFYGVLANLVLLPIFVLPFGIRNQMSIVGVALAYSLAQYVNVAHGWYRLSQIDGNPGRGLVAYTVKLLAASAFTAVVMIAVSFALDLYGAVDKTYLLVFTPVAGVAGLAVLAVVMALLNGREMAGWRAALRRGRATASMSSTSLAADATESAPALGGDVLKYEQDAVEDGVDVDQSVDLESTSITANLP